MARPKAKPKTLGQRVAKNLDKRDKRRMRYKTAKLNVDKEVSIEKAKQSGRTKRAAFHSAAGAAMVDDVTRDTQYLDGGIGGSGPAPDDSDKKPTNPNKDTSSDDWYHIL